MRATTEFFKDRDDDKVIPPGEGVMGVTLKRCPTCESDDPAVVRRDTAGPLEPNDDCADPFHTASEGEGK